MRNFLKKTIRDGSIVFIKICDSICTFGTGLVFRELCLLQLRVYIAPAVHDADDRDRLFFISRNIEHRIIFQTFFQFSVCLRHLAYRRFAYGADEYAFVPAQKAPTVRTYSRISLA